MLSISTQFAAYAPAAQPLVQARASVVMESKASLEALAKELNPSIGYWDPIGLANLGGNDGSPASGEAVGADSIGQERFIGYLRHSEIKHGRIAMAGFLGYCVQCLDVVKGEHTTLPYRGFVADVTPQEQWDNIPVIGKLQILTFVGMLESYGEIPGEVPHYTQPGGIPGYYPPLVGKRPELLFNLYDPVRVWERVLSWHRHSWRSSCPSPRRLSRLTLPAPSSAAV